MADNYLENRFDDYLKRKAAWQKSKRRQSLNGSVPPERPDDESL
ncbi:MAG: dehydrogenase [Bacteroidaceae bacterium]